MMLRLCLAVIFFCALAIEIAPAQDPILEPIKEGEVEYNDADEKDKEFDNDILTTEGRPDEKPDQNRVESLYKSQAAKLSDAREQAVSVNLYVDYYLQSQWYSPYYRCCPRSQNYDCRSVSRRLPCFSHLVNGVREWCCPFYPTVYIANCNCGTCIKQCPYGECFATGKCNRRYSARKFYAVCFNRGWNVIRYLTKYLPTSCYCRAACRRPIITDVLTSVNKGV